MVTEVLPKVSDEELLEETLLHIGCAIMDAAPEVRRPCRPILQACRDKLVNQLTAFKDEVAQHTLDAFADGVMNAIFLSPHPEAACEIITEALGDIELVPARKGHIATVEFCPMPDFEEYLEADTGHQVHEWFDGYTLEHLLDEENNIARVMLFFAPTSEEQTVFEYDLALDLLKDTPVDSEQFCGMVYGAGKLVIDQIQKHAEDSLPPKQANMVTHGMIMQFRATMIQTFLDMVCDARGADPGLSSPQYFNYFKLAS